MNRNRFIVLLVLSVAFLSVLKAQDLKPPAKIAGNWTIFAEDIDHPGSSLKTIQITQNGNIISGTFRGPHQHGKFQGWVSGNHVEFSTDTHEILTFRGEIKPDRMSGLYGINGRHAPWSAERSAQ